MSNEIKLKVGRHKSAYHSALLPTIPWITSERCMFDCSYHRPLPNTAINRVRKYSRAFIDSNITKYSV